MTKKKPVNTKGVRGKRARKVTKKLAKKQSRRGTKAAVEEFLQELIGDKGGKQEVFRVLRIKGGHVIDVRALPQDPGMISHILLDIVNAYSQSYGIIGGVNPDKATALIITHFGELLEKQYPEERIKEMVEERRAAFEDTELGGKGKVH